MMTNKKTILIVFGTRPEAIKMAPLVKEFQKHKDEVNTIVCVTGQHREMLDQVLDIFDIKPDYDLDIMMKGQDLFDVTTKVMFGMRCVLREVSPDIVFVHGDTTTAMASALSAFYCQTDIAHIEAGLRTYNMYSPWPEEMNRTFISKITKWHFAPTEKSRENLLKENVFSENVFVTGNTVIDALHLCLEKVKSNINTEKRVVDEIRKGGYDTERLDGERKLILITGHRRENFGEGFMSICKAIKRLAEEYNNIDFVYPMHLNPNVRKPISEVFGDKKQSNLFFIEPQEYMSFVYLMSKSHLVLTDSGGIQEEAPSIGKPVLVMRDTTERPEALEAGTVKLVGTDENLIVDTVKNLLDKKEYYNEMAKAINPYGDGKACIRIVENIIGK